LKIVLLLCLTLFLNARSIEFLDAKVLDNPKIDGLKFTEISDLAYDKTQDLFYAVSDRGRVFKIKISIVGDEIKEVNYLEVKTLRGKDNKKLTRRYKDSESLAIVGDKLLISFEGKSRIVKYDKNLNYIKKLKLPKDLKSFVKMDHSSDGFEAMTYSNIYGFITAREKPFWNQRAKGYHAIFGKDGEICKIKVDKYKSAITEFEMMDDGKLLAIFRDFNFKRLSFKIALKMIDIDNPKNGICEVTELAKLDGLKNRFVDNYEGLTHYKDNLYLMISDDNNNLFQRTILRLFRIKDER
jgi:hypothetical protein